jgi:hypothetical protein
MRVKRFRQKEYSIRSFIRNFNLTKDYLERKLRQLSDSKLMMRFRSIFPKSYNYLKSLKTKLKL